MLACHGVFDPDANVFDAEHPEDRPIYEAQLAAALGRVTGPGAGSSLLVISGGFTRPERSCSESRSYLSLARVMALAVPTDLALEEYALTSIENLLLSLYVYHQRRQAYPERIEVVSWAFKQRRFEATLAAISRWRPLGESWPALNFLTEGDLPAAAKATALAKEDAYIELLQDGIEAYYQHPTVRDLLARRDGHATRPLARTVYAGYPLPF